MLQTPGLDKSALGELLGHHEDLEIATMHAFVDLVDFSRHPLFDEALRHFLDAFR
jgi:brefeldin A-inhibited guanine nucleotide-exchange protein